MYIQLEERYEERDSSVHRLDPRTKLLVALGLIIAISLLPFGRWGLYALIWLCVMAISWMAKIGPKPVLKRSFVAIPFALAALALPFTVPGQVVGYLPLLNWPVTLEGLVRAGSILVKSWVSVQVAIVLVMVTPLADLLWALRRLHVPEPLVAIASFMYRYLFVLADEAGRLLRARASRSAAQVGHRAGNTLLWRGQVAGYMVGSLMLRSFERSERIYHAMAARGYAGELKSFAHHNFTPRDGWVLACAGAFVLLIVFVGR
jgi:cobalt/nickel transport system permease protein